MVRFPTGFTSRISHIHAHADTIQTSTTCMLFVIMYTILIRWTFRSDCLRAANIHSIDVLSMMLRTRFVSLAAAQKKPVLPQPLSARPATFHPQRRRATCYRKSESTQIHARTSFILVARAFDRHKPLSAVARASQTGRHSHSPTHICCFALRCATRNKRIRKPTTYDCVRLCVRISARLRCDESNGLASRIDPQSELIQPETCDW